MAKPAEESQAAERSAITHPARAELGESPPPEAAGTQAAGRGRFKTEHFIEVRCTNTSSRVGQWKDQKPLPHERKLQTRIGKNKRCSSNRRNQLQSRIEAVCLTRQGFHWRYSEATCSRRMRHQEERILLLLSEEKEQMKFHSDAICCFRAHLADRLIYILRGHSRFVCCFPRLLDHFSELGRGRRSYRFQYDGISLSNGKVIAKIAA